MIKNTASTIGSDFGLGIEHKQVDDTLADNLALGEYLQFMKKVITKSKTILKDNGLAAE